MKKFFLMAAAILMFGTLSAADQVDKLWLTDYDQAVKTAKETKRPILMLFTGSDWCPYCVKLEKNVLSKTEFKKYAKDNLVLLYLDFPRRKYISGKQKAHNQQLRFEMRINNPALTAQVLVASARAAVRLSQEERFGCYTLIDIPPIMLLPGDRMELLGRLV